MKIRYLISFVIMFSLFSCVTQKQRMKICNTCAVKDSIVYKEKIVLKDTTIYTTTPGPIQYLENPCKDLCDSMGNLKKIDIVEKKNGIKSTVKSVGKSLVFHCEADSLKSVITLLEKTISEKSKLSEVKYIDCQKEHKTRFDGFLFWFFWIVAPLLLIRFLWKYFKTYIKL